MEARKNPSFDIYRMSTLFFNIGLVVSMSLVYAVFHIKFEDAPINLASNQSFSTTEQIIDIPITVQPTPPPPKVQIHQIIETSNEEVIIEDLLSIDLEMQENTSIAAATFQEDDFSMAEEEPEEADQIFNIVEVAASPVGGVEAFYQYVADQLKDNYPYVAKKMNISGVVYIQFVVEKDGAITQVEAIKGIGGGCDELAVEVLKNAPNWNPGKQRGIAVRTRKMVPIRFMLKTR